MSRHHQMFQERSSDNWPKKHPQEKKQHFNLFSFLRLNKCVHPGFLCLFVWQIGRKVSSRIKNILSGTQPSVITVEVVFATSRPQAPPHLQMMPMDVLVNVVMPEGTEWHFDDFNMLMCIYIHSKASLFKQQRTLNLTQLHIICSKHSIGSQMIPTATTNVIQIVSKHWIGQILVLTFQPHQPLHINLVFCNICRDATKCLRRNPFSSKSIFCLEPPCSNCDVHYFGWSKLISTTTNLQNPSPSPYSVFFWSFYMDVKSPGCQNESQMFNTMTWVLFFLM